MSLKAHGIARLGRTPEVRYTASGEPVVALSLAFTARNGSEELTQWVDGSFWGSRAVKLSEYLAKGQQIGVDLDNLHQQTFTTRTGTQGTKVAARVVDITLLDRKLQDGTAPASAAPAQPPAAAPRPTPAPVAQAAPTGAGFEDLDSDIPF